MDLGPSAAAEQRSLRREWVECAHIAVFGKATEMLGSAPVNAFSQLVTVVPMGCAGSLLENEKIGTKCRLQQPPTPPGSGPGGMSCIRLCKGYCVHMRMLNAAIWGLVHQHSARQ